MEEQRLQTYLDFIQELYNYATDEELQQFWQNHPDLINKGLIQVMQRVASQMAKNGEERIAN